MKFRTAFAFALLVASMASAVFSQGASSSNKASGSTRAPAAVPTAGAVKPKVLPTEESILSGFSAASEEWGNGVEAILEDAYRKCFRTYVIDGRIMTIRMPFGENFERSELADNDLIVQGGGKADPTALWDEIDALLIGSDFSSYVRALNDGRDKIITFDLQTRSWSVILDRFYIERMSGGSYPGLPHIPYVLVAGEGTLPADVYNYIYCVGRLGMDCSGFVWYELKSVAAKGRIDLDKLVLGPTGAPNSSKASLFIGTWFFDPGSKNFQEVKDQIRNLKPADILLFRGEDGSILHSGIIQSIDFSGGRIRYLQSTDEAPQDERGVHESLITFDPAHPEASLKDPSVQWHQKRLSTFLGELPTPFRDDGDRFRAYPDLGGGTVVRLKAIQKAIADITAKATAVPRQ